MASRATSTASRCSRCVGSNSTPGPSRRFTRSCAWTSTGPPRRATSCCLRSRPRASLCKRRNHRSLTSKAWRTRSKASPFLPSTSLPPTSSSRPRAHRRCPTRTTRSNACEAAAFPLKPISPSWRAVGICEPAAAPGNDAGLALRSNLDVASGDAEDAPVGAPYRARDLFESLDENASWTSRIVAAKSESPRE